MGRQRKKTKTKPLRSIEIETRIRLGPITLFLLIVSRKPRFSRKISVIEIINEAL